MRKILSVCLLLVSIGGIAISAANLIPYMREEVQSASLYAELAVIHAAGDSHSAAVAPETISAEDVPEGSIAKDALLDDDAPDEDEDMPLEEMQEPISPPVIHTGLLALHEKNPDCVAWITIGGTVIDYPVMYRPTQKNYYLHRDFNGSHASAGALFIAENCDPDDCDNVIIYGHHMNSGKMFAALTRYKKQSFYEEHRWIIYETLHGSETYEIMFVFTTPVYTGHDFAYYTFSKANSAEEYDAFISACRERALYDTGVTAQYGDKLLTLSTCEYSQKNGRMVVVTRKTNE